MYIIFGQDILGTKKAQHRQGKPVQFGVNFLVLKILAFKKGDNGEWLRLYKSFLPKEEMCPTLEEFPRQEIVSAATKFVKKGSGWEATDYQIVQPNTARKLTLIKTNFNKIYKKYFDVGLQSMKEFSKTQVSKVDLEFFGEHIKKAFSS